LHELGYERPGTCEEALGLLARDGARVLAGGTDLIPQLSEGRRRPSVLVDVKHVPELREITPIAGGGWRFGAAASVLQLARHAGFVADHASLIDAGRLIGSLQVQSRASLGGNLCNAAPSADAVPLIAALDAVAVIASAKATRRVPAEAVATGPGRTQLAADEMLIALELPARALCSAAQYLRFTPRREMDIAIAGAGVRIDLDAAGRIAVVRVVLASVAPLPLRAVQTEALLVGQSPSAALFAAAGAEAAREAQPISDTRGSADYRRDLVDVLTRRALAACAAQLGGPVT
jgi:CO/xanthine dehydrogenase FAD-binding subunit